MNKTASQVKLKSPRAKKYQPRDIDGSVWKLEMVTPVDQHTQITLSTPIALRTMDREFREGYVRGYAESATLLLSICDRIFVGSGMMQYVRDRFTENVEGAAITLDSILREKKEIFRMDVDVDPALDIDFDPARN